MDSGAIAWVLMSSALVLFMTPGLALFYGGMTRSKNVLNMLNMNLYCMAIVPVLWVVLGYTLAFGGGGDGGWIGNFDFVGLKDVFPDPTGETIVFSVFQLTFAVITPALISGAVADRLRFSAWVVFVPVWALLVYSPIAHWVFAGGWLADLGALDFAGGAVVHMNAGAAALAVILLLGKRRGWPSTPMPPHNLTMTMLGTGILFFGWFGFNAGSALAADGIAAVAFLNTFVAAAAGGLVWTAVEWAKDGHPTTLGVCSGIVAGLVAITPCAGFVGGLSPLVIGGAAGAICFLAISFKYKAGYDDSLDVVGVHLVGGLFGSLVLGLFADSAVNTAVVNEGLFLGGGFDLLVDQAIAAAATLGFAFVVTLIIAKAIDVTIGLRVSEPDEQQGLDLSLHAESGYNLADHS